MASQITSNEAWEPSVHQVSGAGGRGEALRFAAPPSGGAWRVKSFEESAESEASGSLRPCRRPLPKVSQNPSFF